MYMQYKKLLDSSSDISNKEIIKNRFENQGYLFLKEVLDFMIDNKNGHIINIGSIAGKEVYPKGNIYCA